MMDPEDAWRLAKARQIELHKQAEIYSLYRAARAGRPHFHQRFLAGLGALLIALGTGLRRRYAEQELKLKACGRLCGTEPPSVR